MSISFASEQIVGIMAAAVRKSFEDEEAAVRDAGLTPHPSIRAHAQATAHVVANGLERLIPGFDRQGFYELCGV